MNFKYLLYIFLFANIFFYGCKKSSPNLVKVDEPTTSNPPNGQVTIDGHVYKDDGSDADNTTITIDGHTTYTNQNGTFSFTGKVTDTNKVVIKFTKPGFIDDWRILMVETGAVTGGLKIYLNPATNAGSFNASDGGNVSLGKLSLIFPANAVIKPDGTPYTGNVTVIAPEIGFMGLNKSPCGMQAIGTNNTKLVLESLELMYVNLKGQTGESLKLSKPMIFKFNMGWGADMTALATTKLWAFSETDHVWMENGSVTLTGTSYTGSTTNLNYIQFAESYKPALLRADIHDILLNPATNFSLTFVSKQYHYLRGQSAPINSKGICLMYVPASVDSRIGLISPCEGSVQDFSSDPFTPGEHVNKSYIVNLSKYITIIAGHVYECDFQPINGRAELNVNGTIYSSPIINGQYTFKTLTCDGYTYNTIMSIYDNNNNLLKKISSFPFYEGLNLQEGNINICSRPITGSLTLTSSDKTYTYSTPADTIQYLTSMPFITNPMTVIIFKNAKYTFGFTTDNITVGSSTIFTLAGNFPGVGSLNIFADKTSNVTITKYQTGNTLIEGTFKANVYLNGSVANKVDVSGTFKLNQ